MKSLQAFEKELERSDSISIPVDGDRELVLHHFMHAEKKANPEAVVDTWANDDCSIQVSHMIIESRNRQFRYVMMFSQHGRIPEEVGVHLIAKFLPDELMVDGAYIDTLPNWPPALVLSNVVSIMKPGLVRPGID